VKVGDEIDVKVLRVDTSDRKIGLSKRNVDDPTVPEDAITDIPEDSEIIAEAPPSDKLGGDKARNKDLRGGTGTAGPLFQMPGQ
ncbi:MAG: 30S ribosomal protein S1, partial [Gemmataceae bacterium]